MERIKYRQSLLNRLNRAYDADPAKIVRKGTFQICRCRAKLKNLKFIYLINYKFKVIISFN